jgi:hypothetical protein
MSAAFGQQQQMVGYRHPCAAFMASVRRIHASRVTVLYFVKYDFGRGAKMIPGLKAASHPKVILGIPFLAHLGKGLKGFFCQFFFWHETGGFTQPKS